MKIRTMVLASAVSLALLLGIGGLDAFSNINKIRVGGPLQRQGQETSDLVADILPPPEYIIEPYLEATLLHDTPATYGQHAARLVELRKAYDDRHRYWLNSTLDGSLRATITQSSHAPAMRFWQELDRDFLPAVRSGDEPRIDASYQRLTAAYAEHRAAIDRAVAAATEYQTKLAAESKATLHRSLVVLGVIGLLVLAGVAGFCWLVLQRLVSPLTAFGRTMNRMSAGDLDGAVPGQNRKDEVGDVARALVSFKTAEVEKRTLEQAARAKQAEQEIVVRALGDGLKRLADGDLSRGIDIAVGADYEVLRGNFNRALASLGRLLGAIAESAASIRTGSGEIAHASEDLARRTEGNAASLEQTSAALTQIDGRIKQTAIASAQTVERADQTIATVGDGRAVADQAVQAMGRVADSAKGIDNVIEGLDKIAFQTRVLAMNAAVEAGRAGEAGRGFAVVADLVGQLAMRSEEEAKQARDQLTATQADIVTAVEAVHKVDGALADIAGDVGEVHQLLGAMAADNQAQSAAITEISAAIGTMDHATQQNAAMVEQTSAAARNLTSEVGSLAEQAGAFTVAGQPERRIPLAA